MATDKELEIRLQFLDEAQEYLTTLESSVMGLAHHRIDGVKINAALRAAHSIKGGAGMMGFQALSQLAHRLEDFLKSLKVQKQTLTVEPELERLLLAAIACLRQFIERDRHEVPPDPDWIDTQILPIFESLQHLLGDPQEEDAHSILSPEEGQDIIPLLFQTEVEGCLQRLETVLADPQLPCLAEELTILAQELGGLGEMLDLTAFYQLCESILQQIDAHPDQVHAIAITALQTWRRSQELVFARQWAALPCEITLTDLSPASAHEPVAGQPDPLEASAQWLPIERVVAAQSPTSVAPTPVAAHETVATDYRVLEIKPDPKPTRESAETTVRVPSKKLDQLNDLFGELTIERNGLDMRLKRLQHLVGMLSRRVQVLEQSNDQLRVNYDQVNHQVIAPSSTAMMAIATHATPDSLAGSHEASSVAALNPLNFQFDALELDRYTDLNLLSQNVIETIVQVQEVTSDIELELQETEQTLRELNKTARQVRTNLNQVRMRPLADIVDRFPVALRELSLQHGKEVTLQIEGGHILIDRNILDTLNDPLMHLLRNAFDHGIEDPTSREAMGKSRQGVIKIQASQRSNRTVITIQDDGAGIDLDKIRSRAHQMGLDAALLATASDEELLSLIFEPGFSTASQVTSLSGRGVGLDVVRDHLKQIQGEIRIDTQPGLGTTFILSVPFTLSVTRTLLADSNGLLLAFPKDAIAELLVLDADQIVVTANNEAFQWNDKLVQLVRLSQWLPFHCPRHFADLETPPVLSGGAVLMVNQGNQWYGLQIDRFWGEQEVAVRRVEGHIAMPSGFSNCIILGDGRAVPLVSVPDLLHWMISYERSRSLSHEGRSQSDAVATSSPSYRTTSHVAFPPKALVSLQQRTILIVDDSINVRRFLALTLEKAGYRIEQAKDGLDAVEKLQRGLQVQAVICDIEMPRLDGYGLLARIKSMPQFAQLPILMLTSRSSPKHRQLAMSLGATDYFSKPYNEQALLQALEKSMAG